MPGDFLIALPRIKLHVLQRAAVSIELLSCGVRRHVVMGRLPVLSFTFQQVNDSTQKTAFGGYTRERKGFLFSPTRRAAPARGSAKGTRPFGIPFPPAGGDRCVHRCCHAVPAPPEWRRGGWLTAANLFKREYILPFLRVSAGICKNHKVIRIPNQVPESQNRVLPKRKKFIALSFIWVSCSFAFPLLSDILRIKQISAKS